MNESAASRYRQLSTSLWSSKRKIELLWFCDIFKFHPDEFYFTSYLRMCQAGVRPHTVNLFSTRPRERREEESLHTKVDTRQIVKLAHLEQLRFLRVKLTLASAGSFPNYCELWVKSISKESISSLIKRIYFLTENQSFCLKLLIWFTIPRSLNRSSTSADLLN